MKLSKPLCALILIASALLLSGARSANADSKNHPAQHHENKAAAQAQSVENKQPAVQQVPLSVWQNTDAALHESIAANKEQAIATQKQAEANKQTFCSPAVVVNEILALVGGFYLIFMGLQWKTMKESLRITSRAALGIKGFNLTFNNAANKWIIMFLENYGRLAAEKIRINVHATGSGDPPEKVDYATMPQPDLSQMTVGEMMPNVPHPVPIDLTDMTDDHIAKINAKEIFLYVVGFVKYDDGFGEERTLPIRFSYDPGPPQRLNSAIERTKK
jgi:hypothetical protein